MSAKISKTPERKPRADAERNRVHVLETAKKVFAAKGAGASLEAIARDAGVGIGTLYRHFPTRDALVEEVYRNELEQLTSAAQTLALTESPVEALRTWMGLFVEYTATKAGMAESLASLAAGTSKLYAETTVRLTDAMKLLTDRAVASGDIVLVIDPLDLLRALFGVATASNGPSWKAGAMQLIDILINGIRTTRAKPRSGGARARSAKPRTT